MIGLFQRSPFAQPRPPRLKPRLAALAIALAVASVATVSTDAHAQDADALFQEGNKAYDDNDYALAAKKYGEAFALKPTFDIAANLGAAELKLARFAEAANHLAFAVRNFPPSGDQKKKAGAERLYGEARQKVGAFEITAPAGAIVLVDGKNVGKAPLADPVYVDPGAHKVEAQNGDQRGETEARVLASETAKVDVKLTETGAPPPPITQPPGGEPHADGPPLWPGFALAGASVVGVGVGIGLFAAGGSADSDGDAIAKEIEESGTRCAEPQSGPLVDKCAEGEDKQSQAQGLQLGGGIAIGVGGALALGGVAYLVWAAMSDDQPAVSSVQPWVSPDLLGGAFRTSF